MKLMKLLLVPVVLVLFFQGCDARDSGEAAYKAPTIADVAYPSGWAGADAGSVDIQNQPGQGPEDWIQAPAGHCDNPDNIAHVTWVKDGDTVQIDWPHPEEPGKKASVRYIGVAAAEADECWGPEGTAALQTLTPLDGIVCLQREYDSANYDMYGRYLRWVFVQLEDGRWVLQNQRLVRLGDSKAYHQYLKGRIYEAELKAAETKAYAEARGGWKDCGW